MTKASAETFLLQMKSGKPRGDKERIFTFIKRHPGVTKDDIIRELKISHQTATARLSDLFDLGIVEVVATQTLISSQLSVLRVQTNLQAARVNAKNRFNDKRKKWIKAGERNGFIIPCACKKSA